MPPGFEWPWCVHMHDADAHVRWRSRPARRGRTLLGYPPSAAGSDQPDINVPMLQYTGTLPIQCNPTLALSRLRGGVRVPTRCVARHSARRLTGGTPQAPGASAATGTECGQRAWSINTGQAESKPLHGGVGAIACRVVTHALRLVLGPRARSDRTRYTFFVSYPAVSP